MLGCRWLGWFLWIGPGWLTGLGETGLPILVYDYAGVPASTLAEAKQTAKEILAGAGVRPDWLDCTAEKGCDGQADGWALQLRVVDEPIAKRMPTSRHSLGYAVVANGAGRVASVFYHRAVELEKENVANRGAILGAILAHEIGHLLLGSSSHTGEGIMRPVWGKEDLRKIARGRLLFAGGQAGRIGVRVRQLADGGGRSGISGRP